MVQVSCPFCSGLNRAPGRELYQFTATMTAEDKRGMEAQRTEFTEVGFSFSI